MVTGLTLTIGEALARAQRMLLKMGEESPGAGSPMERSASPRLDAEVLLAHVLGRDRVYLYRESQTLLDPEQARVYFELVRRRALGEPVAYLTGQKEFMGLDFMVGPPVLIPRPETELLVASAQALLEQWPTGQRVVVDVGTGSGAVAISLAHLVPGARVYATDISARALAMARANACRHGVEVSYYQGDLLAPLTGVLKQGTVAVVAANLPYLPSATIPTLSRDVRDYEPRLALDGGADGLSLYRRLVPRAAGMLAPGGHLLLEMAPDQRQQALALVPSPRWSAKVLPDLAGHPRLVVARRNRC